VFLNLLINAAHAIPEGAADRHRIRVATSTGEDGGAVIEIEDTGEGIAAARLERIFDPFFTTKPIGVGTGLGLSICRNLVRAMGGEIEVESVPERGSLFRVRLPAAAGEDRPAPSLTPAAPSRRGRILAVDDEPLVANAIRRALAREYEVVTETSPRAALDLAARGSFDVVICDLMMPEMTGMDFFSELSAVAPDLSERVLFLSGGAFTPAARAFLERARNPCMEKPFDTEQLRAMVRGLMG
jgi:CheY-like chemotaxis protein